MRYLIVATHGDTGLGYSHLSEEGEAEIRGLAWNIEALLPDIERVKIITSAATRTQESATIIGKIIGAPIEVNTLFGNEQGEIEPDTANKALCFLATRASNVEALILVTHGGAARFYASHHLAAVQGQPNLINSPRYRLQEGEAFFIDLTTFQWKKIP